ncbi:MAG TPA: endonuclease/exonuclease/phosphatase family protein [Rhodothermales bacterium]|nr:endonuclease/exonuclease/phosphatase family protein [Rhodothermales bacterium]
MRCVLIAVPVVLLILVGCRQMKETGTPLTIRVATFNVEDVRTVDLLQADHPRLRKIASEIREIDPDIILINEMQYDQEGDPWAQSGQPEGLNAQRFVGRYLAELSPEKGGYRAFMLPSNTGLPSGFDLNNDGDTVRTVPPIPDGDPDGSPGPQTPEGRAYGNDAYGFGMFPGQYAMALLVKDQFSIVDDSVRSFRNFLWKDLPQALLPVNPPDNEPWYSSQEWDAFRLSSKSHWDVPVEVGAGRLLHILASHPTPPAFDGPEKRNQYRNHDEIRFWNEYLSDSSFIVDDQGRRGGLASGASFVIVGDLNADVDEGSAYDNPVKKYLLDNPKVNGSFTPTADQMVEDLDGDDTAWWGLRVDYVLPSADLQIVDGGVHRHTTVREEALHDHFPVWIDVVFSHVP